MGALASDTWDGSYSRPYVHTTKADAETADPHAAGVASKPDPKRSILPEQDGDVIDVQSLVAEATDILRSAGEEIDRVRASAAKATSDMRREVEENYRLLRMTEEQLGAAEKRYADAERDAAHWRDVAAEEIRRRSELDRRVQSDQHKISFLEKMLNDARERIAIMEDRVQVAETRAKTAETEMRTLVEQLRQKLIPAKDGPRRTGATLLTALMMAVASWFVMMPTDSARAFGAEWYEGSWGPECMQPALRMTDDAMAFRGEISGEVKGDYLQQDDRLTFRSAEERGVTVTVVKYGPDAIHVRDLVVAGLAVNTDRPILVRCSLRAPA